MLSPEEIAEETKSMMREKEEKSMKMHMVTSIIGDGKKFFSDLTDKIIQFLSKSVFRVEVKNQIKLPEVQKVDGSVSLKEIRTLVVGLNEVVKALDSTKKSIEKSSQEISKNLKPEKVDFSRLEQAVKNIEIPEVKIPEYPTEISVKNLFELKKSFDELGKKFNIKFPEIKFPDFPTDISVNNLDGLAEKITEAVSNIHIPESKEIDFGPIVEAQKRVEEAIAGIRFPIQNASKSSWDHSLSMKEKDLEATYTYTSAGGRKVVQYIDVVIPEGMYMPAGTYRRTFTYDSGGDVTHKSVWEKQ